jgi:hypothetical protein
MENKQTAVQWLQDKFLELKIEIDSKTHEEAFFLFEQAKQMEREQIMNAFDSGYFSYEVLFYDNAEEYFNENYIKQ